jgi:hypothetical protein
MSSRFLKVKIEHIFSLMQQELMLEMISKMDNNLK